MRWFWRSRRTTLEVSPSIYGLSDRVLYGTGWRARRRKRRGKTRPIYLGIDHGTDSAESVVIVGQKDGKFIVERTKW